MPYYVYDGATEDKLIDPKYMDIIEKHEILLFEQFITSDACDIEAIESLICPQSPQTFNISGNEVMVLPFNCTNALHLPRAIRENIRKAIDSKELTCLDDMAHAVNGPLMLNGYDVILWLMKNRMLPRELVYLDCFKDIYNLVNKDELNKLQLRRTKNQGMLLNDLVSLAVGIYYSSADDLRDYQLLPLTLYKNSLRTESLYCSATGKIFNKFLPEREKQNRIIWNDLKKIALQAINIGKIFVPQKFVGHWNMMIDEEIFDKWRLDNDIVTSTKPLGQVKITNSFTLSGKCYEIIFNGNKLPPLNGTNGLHYLHTLLKHPHKSFTANDLYNICNPSNPIYTEINLIADQLDNLQTSNDTVQDDYIIDEETLSSLKNSIVALDEKIEIATKTENFMTAEALEKEREDVIDYIKKATYKGKRKKFTTDSDSRRTTVTQSIDRAIKTIGKADSELQKHLEDAIKTGADCVYRPITDMSW